MEIETKLLESGEMDGKIVWVTDHRVSDDRSPLKKPIRDIKPTKCVVASEKLYARIRVAYFFPLLKNGKPSKKTISLYDNTGYRAYRGFPAKVFTTEKEALGMYAVQKATRIAAIKEYVAEVKATAAALVESLQ